MSCRGFGGLREAGDDFKHDMTRARREAGMRLSMV